MSQEPLIDPAIEAIARDDGLTDALKQQLIGVAHDTAQSKVVQSQTQTQFDATHKRGRWNTPLWVALTGLITLGGNFAFDYWRTEQAGQITQSQAVLDAKNDREIAQNNAAAERTLQAEKLKADQQAQALSFQYEVIKTELANLKTAEERANSLRLLVRIGVLGEPLKLDQINAILSEVEDGKAESLPPVGGGDTDGQSHQFKPCRDPGLTARVTPETVEQIKQQTGVTSKMNETAPDHIEALRWAMANNGICGPEQIAFVLALTMLETAHFRVFEMSEAVAIRSFKSRLLRVGGNETEEDAVLYRPRGLAMLAGKRAYASYAQRLNRPELLENPDIASADADISAEIFVESLKATRVLDHCKEGDCDLTAAIKRYFGPRGPERQLRQAFDVALLAMLE